jgi:hypothetical protein
VSLHNKAHPILLIADQIPSDDRGSYKLAVVSAKSFLKILGIFFFYIFLKIANVAKNETEEYLRGGIGKAGRR